MSRLGTIRGVREPDRITYCNPLPSCSKPLIETETHRESLRCCRFWGQDKYVIRSWKVGLRAYGMRRSIRTGQTFMQREEVMPWPTERGITHIATAIKAVEVPKEPGISEERVIVIDLIAPPEGLKTFCTTYPSRASFQRFSFLDNGLDR
ncbi:hypothetical protein BC629DRAFT_1179353 [Irpex lacteus]|nr:hypothetical protein BC629DRAFT_1179353 [Irpex lacteus]